MSGQSEILALIVGEEDSLAHSNESSRKRKFFYLFSRCSSETNRCEKGDTCKEHDTL